MSLYLIYKSFPFQSVWCCVHLGNMAVLNSKVNEIIIIYTILPKVLAPLLMKGVTTLVISMSTDLNV